MKTANLFNAALISTGLLCLSSCGSEVVTVDLDGSEQQKAYALTSSQAQALAGGADISYRQGDIDFTATSVPRLAFKQVDSAELSAKLQNMTNMLLGNSASQDTVDESDDEYTISRPGKGISYASKQNGFWAVKKHDFPRNSTVVQNAGDAVNRALSQIAEKGLISTLKGETIDVTGIASTHYAGWMANGSQLVAVGFVDAKSGEKLKQYRSEYTVYFGRKYKGVPILGNSLVARLDSDGLLVAVMNSWREIAGEVGLPVSVQTASQVAPELSAEQDEAFELANTVCGYTEGSSGKQTEAGLGCKYQYKKTEPLGDLNDEFEVWVNASGSENLPMWSDFEE